jgi:hypothetical protein
MSRVSSKLFRAGDKVGMWIVIGRSKDERRIRIKCSGCGRAVNEFPGKIAGRDCTACANGRASTSRRIGQKFGRFTVVGKVGKHGFWLYKCPDCGDTWEGTIQTARDRIGGGCPKCRPKQHAWRVGDRHNNLTVVEHVEFTRRIWECSLCRGKFEANYESISRRKDNACSLCGPACGQPAALADKVDSRATYVVAKAVERFHRRRHLVRVQGERFPQTLCGMQIERITSQAAQDIFDAEDQCAACLSKAKNLQPREQQEASA